MGSLTMFGKVGTGIATFDELSRQQTSTTEVQTLEEDLTHSGTVVNNERTGLHDACCAASWLDLARWGGEVIKFRQVVQRSSYGY